MVKLNIIMLQKPIDYVFIDTSVFMREAYFKKTGAVSRLFELAANGWIRVLMPEIARRMVETLF